MTIFFCARLRHLLSRDPITTGGLPDLRRLRLPGARAEPPRRRRCPADLGAIDAPAARCAPPPTPCAPRRMRRRPGRGARGRARRPLPALRLRRRSRMKLRSITLTDVRSFAGATARL